jgi:hypothetical protein
MSGHCGIIPPTLIAERFPLTFVSLIKASPRLPATDGFWPGNKFIISLVDVCTTVQTVQV